MKIKICGLFRDEDIDYVNESRPDYIGFVFAQSRRKISPSRAAQLRQRLSDGIIPVGVFVDAPAADIAGLYHEGVIAIAQLHGAEDDAYISRLRETSAAGGYLPIPVIKTIKSDELVTGKSIAKNSDYYLIDSGAGGGRPFDWGILDSPRIPRAPWFLAGGIGLDNIEKAMTLNPFAVDISSGAETEGVKNREKIAQLTSMAKKADNV